VLKRGESADPAAPPTGAEWIPPADARSLVSGAAELRAGSHGLTHAETSDDSRRAGGTCPDAILAVASDAFAILPAARLVGAGAFELVRALRRIESALRDALPVESVLGVRYQRSVTIAVDASGDSIAPGAAKFGMRLRLPRSGELAIAVIDRAACEALANVFMAFYAPLRGYGDPTRVETALLEFAATLAIDDLRREGAEAIGGAALVGFLDKSELAPSAPHPGHPLSLRIVVDQREGRGTVYLQDLAEAPPARVLPCAKRVETRTDARSSVEVRLALPAIELLSDEWKDAALGDVLLLGATDLTSLCGAWLVTDTGWRLAPATIEFDSPVTTSVALGTLDPDAFFGEPGAQGAARVVPTMGAARFTLEQIAAWKNGARVDLPKANALPVSIFHAGVELARGELVRADGEIGIRLGAIYRKEVAS
jgi:hypothetical protein